MRRGSLLVALAIACFVQVLVPLQASADPASATVYDVPSPPLGLTFGADGNLWFTEYSVGKIAFMTPSGSITEFPIPSGPLSLPVDITSGPDGNLWFTELDKIGRVSTTGSFAEFPLPHSGDVGYISSITVGPDGNLWFTENGANLIGSITPNGAISEFAVPTPDSEPWSITAGSDGNLWFTEASAKKIARVTTAGVFTEFSIPSGTTPRGITNGPDGNVWFVAGTVGRVNPSGVITEFPVPGSPSGMRAIVSGSDGKLWFTTSSSTIGRATPQGSIDMLPAPDFGNKWYMTEGLSRAVWYSNYDTGKIVRVLLPTSADLQVSITDSPDPVQRNKKVKYTISVMNAGPDTAESVALTQQLPDASQFVSVNSTQGSCSTPPAGGTGTVSCSLGTIATGSTVQITVVAKVTAKDQSTVSSTATASSSSSDPDPSNNSATTSTTVCAWILLGLCL